MSASARAEVVGPLARGLALLRIMGVPGHHRMSPGALAKATGLARSTVDRLISTLVRIGYLRFDGREAELAPRLAELGGAYLASAQLPAVLAPYVTALADDLDESVSVAVPDGDGVRTLAQATRRRPMSLAFRIGDPLPSATSAPAKLFASARRAPGDHRDRTVNAALAAAPAARSTGAPATEPTGGLTGGLTGAPTAGPTNEPASGPTNEPTSGPANAPTRAPESAVGEGRPGVDWAVDDQSIEPGLVAVAVPVRAPDGVPDGVPVCAVSVVSHTSRHTADSLRDHVLPRLRETAARMERAYTAQLAALPGAATPHGGVPGDLPERPTAPPPAPGPATGPNHLVADALRASKEALGAGFLQSLARGLAVLTAFDEHHPRLTLSQVAQATGLPRATARRALLTLEELGYVASADRYFWLLPRVLELGYAPLTQLAFEEVVIWHLAELGRHVHESTSVAVLDGDDIRYVARVPTVRIMSVNITVGTTFPAYATSMGRVLLAGLPPAELDAALRRIDPVPLTPRALTTTRELRAEVERVRRQGYALVDEELELGLRSVAAPVRDRGGRVIAAVNVSTHAGTSTPATSRETLLPPLLTAAAGIEADLRAVAPPG